MSKSPESQAVHEQFISYVKHHLPEGQDENVISVEDHKPWDSIDFHKTEGETDQWFYYAWLRIRVAGYAIRAFGITTEEKTDAPLEVGHDEDYLELYGEEAQAELDRFIELAGSLLNKEAEG